MSNGREVKLKKNRIRWFVTLLAAFICSGAYAQVDTSGIKIDTGKIIKTDTLKISKDSLDAPVTYSAADSIVMDVPSKKVILYNEANTQYQDMDMKAYRIIVDQPKRLVTAMLFLDSAGRPIGQPKFVQGENTMQADSIIYNIDTRKGITKSTYTNQGDMFIYGERIKKVSENEYFALRGRFTTCNLDTPHFAFVANKMKLVNKKVAITGPVHPEFEGVPVPIYLPFGFFPINQGRHSGLLPPQFATNEQFGIGLEGLGYYKVLNENLDAMLRTSIYSYGGYQLTLTSNYLRRYRFRGNVNLSYQNVRYLSNSGTKEFTSDKVFRIDWSHTMDPKARPGTNFTAQVRAGSSKYNRYATNNPTLNFQNELNSSISYSKTWDDSKYNLNITGNHSQNSITRLVSLNLPNITFTAAPIFPLQRKDMEGITPKWYQKLGIGLNSRIAGVAAFYDTSFSTKRLLDTAQWSAEHSIPIQFALPALGPLQINPSVNYVERWYDRQIFRTWDSAAQRVDTRTVKGFYRDENITFGMGMELNAALFGMYNFGKSSRIRAIRHVIRPSVKFNFSPDLSSSANFYTTQVDTAGHVVRFSKYEGTMLGPFGGGSRSAVMSFGIDNNVEMKVRGKDSSSEDKKVRLIDGFGFNSGYDLLADSFNLQQIVFYLRSTLFENINLTAGATLDPYKVDNSGYRINQYTWNGGSFSPGRLTNGNIALSASFKSKEKDDAKKNTKITENSPVTAEEMQSQLDYINRHPAEFADFNIPWSFNVSYALNLYRYFRPDYQGFATTISSTISLNGDFSLTPKWKLGMNSSYDFRGTGLQQLSMFISRDMHCWEMTISLTPVGLYKSFSIVLNPKSGLLRDLRINRSRSFYGGN